MMMDRFVETHASIRIYEGEDGFYGANGSDQFGYADTIEEIREEIDCYWQGAEHGPLNGIFA
jgi:hypothetical protein